MDWLAALAADGTQIGPVFSYKIKSIEHSLNKKRSADINPFTQSIKSVVLSILHT